MPADLESVRQLYDRRYEGDYMSGDSFTRWSHGGVELHRVRDTLSLIPGDRIASILDYGCGRGEWMDELRARFPAATLKGIDISETAIRKAEAARPEHEFRPFDGVRAPFPDGHFDLIFSYHVLEHVLLIEDVVADMTRLVRPGGYLCIIFPCGNPGSFEARLVSRVQGGLEKGPTGEHRYFFEDPTHLRRMPSSEIIRLFRKQGAEINGEFYAHQFYGAVEWISGSGGAFVRDLFGGRRAPDLKGRLELTLIGAVMRCLTMIRDVSSVDLSRPRPAWKRALLQALFPIRLLGKRVSRLLEKVAQREWKSSRLKKNGSAQFLVFRKCPPCL